VKAARSLLAWSQEQLAEASGVSIPTIKRLEAEEGEIGGRAETAVKMIAALEAAGVAFTNGGEPGVKIKAAGEAKPPARAKASAKTKPKGGKAHTRK